MKASINTKAVDLSTTDSAQRLLRTYFRVAACWGLNPQQEMKILGCSRSLFYAWKQGNVTTGLNQGTLERLSYVLRIYAALQILLPIQERANGWVKAPNKAPLFGGATALQRMLGGQVGDLMVVADYLDAQRGGDFS